MKALAIGVLLLFGGCASHSTKASKDYITRLQEPITSWGISILTHTPYSGIYLVDGAGRRIDVYQNNRPAAEEDDELVLQSHEGRRLDYAGEEGAKLLHILESIQQTDDGWKSIVERYADFIRKRRALPNQSLHPTALLGRG